VPANKSVQCHNGAQLERIGNYDVTINVSATCNFGGNSLSPFKVSAEAERVATHVNIKQTN